MEKAKDFLLKNKDLLLLSGQLALAAVVVFCGIRNDLEPQDCKCKRCRKKRKKRKK
ncbi:MAG: hypothetical protein II743_02585 [Lachnospiraceae bacterium]|nr:hypothetical protein [Lachnospiraceae bacterium]